MEENELRIYKQIGSFTLMLVSIGLIIFFLIIPIENEDVDLGFIACCIPFVLCLLFLIIFGYLTPIYVSSKGVRYKKELIEWDNLEITLLPTVTRGRFYFYYVVFSNKQLNYKEIKHQILAGKWVGLLENPLEIILQYYDKPITVLDYGTRKHCGIGKMNGAPKLNKIINDHNAKYTIE